MVPRQPPNYRSSRTAEMSVPAPIGLPWRSPRRGRQWPPPSRGRHPRSTAARGPPGGRDRGETLLSHGSLKKNILKSSWKVASRRTVTTKSRDGTNSSNGRGGTKLTSSRRLTCLMRNADRLSTTWRSSACAGNDGVAAPPLAVVALGVPPPSWFPAFRGVRGHVGGILSRADASSRPDRPCPTWPTAFSEKECQTI